MPGSGALPKVQAGASIARQLSGIAYVLHRLTLCARCASFIVVNILVTIKMFVSFIVSVLFVVRQYGPMRRHRGRYPPRGGVQRRWRRRMVIWEPDYESHSSIWRPLDSAYELRSILDHSAKHPSHSRCQSPAVFPLTATLSYPVLSASTRALPNCVRIGLRIEAGMRRSRVCFVSVATAGYAVPLICERITQDDQEEHSNTSSGH